MCENAQKKFFWKGKRVSEKIYNLRTKQASVGKNLRTVYGCSKIQNSEESNLKDNGYVSDNKHELGRRIVDIQTLGKQLTCLKCKNTLSLQNIVDEERFGLASVFSVKCENCQNTRRVATDEMHFSNTSKQGKKIKHFDVNTSVAMGTINAGMGCSHLNKILASVNVPILQPNTYKLHEKEVGNAAEEIARHSCMEATLLERELTIKNVKEMQKLL